MHYLLFSMAFAVCCLLWPVDFFLLCWIKMISGLRASSCLRVASSAKFAVRGMANATTLEVSPFHFIYQRSQITHPCTHVQHISGRKL